MKEKILFIYDSMMMGGTSTALLSLMNTIDRSKYEISLLLYTNTGPYMEEIPSFVRVLEPAYLESKLLDSRKRKIIKTVLSGKVFLALNSLRKYRNTAKGNFRKILMHYGMAAQVSLSRIVHEEFDYAIGFMEGWSNEYVASSKINAKKKFAWVHPEYKSCYLIPEIDRKTFARVDGIVLVSETCLGQFLEVFPEYEKKTHIVPNIMSSQLVRQKAESMAVVLKKGALNFCTVCRCDVQVKGLDRVLKVFYELKKEGWTQGVFWHLIGGGDDFDQFRRQVDDLGMNDTVILYGNQLNPLPYLRQMDVFLLGSRYEGKPVAVTEAQMLGLPCLVTSYEAAESQVQHGITGMIMENCYKGIYEAVRTVIQNPLLIHKWKINTEKNTFSNEKDIDMFYHLLDMNGE